MPIFKVDTFSINTTNVLRITRHHIAMYIEIDANQAYLNYRLRQ